MADLIRAAKNLRDGGLIDQHQLSEAKKLVLYCDPDLLAFSKSYGTKSNAVKDWLFTRVSRQE